MNDGRKNDFRYLLAVVKDSKEIIVDVWELRKLKWIHVLAPSLTPRGGIGVRMVFRNGKRSELSHSNDVIDACTCIVDLHVNVFGSTHCYGCVVNGNVAMAAC